MGFRYGNGGYDDDDDDDDGGCGDDDDDDYVCDDDDDDGLQRRTGTVYMTGIRHITWAIWYYAFLMELPMKSLNADKWDEDGDEDDALGARAGGGRG